MPGMPPWIAVCWSSRSCDLPAIRRVRRLHARHGTARRVSQGRRVPLIRLEYTATAFHRGFGFAFRGARAQGWWIVDWPDSDEHFSLGVGRLTRLDVGEPRHFSLTDDRIWTTPGFTPRRPDGGTLKQFGDRALREYLLRGGFLVTDDMWGAEAWEVLPSTMDRVFPGQPINDIGWTMR